MLPSRAPRSSHASALGPAAEHAGSGARAPRGGGTGSAGGERRSAAFATVCASALLVWAYSSFLYASIRTGAAHRRAGSPAAAAEAAAAERQGGGSAGGRRIALLHKAHGVLTARGLAAALAAAQEVRRGGGWYRFLYSIHPGGYAPPPNGSLPAGTHGAHAITLLKALLGNESVYVVGQGEVEAAFGAALLTEQRSVIGGGEWGWVANDAAEAAWWELWGARDLPQWAGHLWLVELDVGWTGSLVGALESTVGAGAQADAAAAAAHQFSPAAAGAQEPAATRGVAAGGQRSDAGASGPDWVAFNTARADEGWRWFAARNWQPPGGLWRSYRHAARCSRRLLGAVAAAMRAGRVQSDEATGPTVCAAEAAWCVLDTAWQPGHPAIGRDRATGEALYRWELLIGPQRWATQAAADSDALLHCAQRPGGGGIAAAGAPGGSRAGAGDPCEVGGWLYHKIKW